MAPVVEHCDVMVPVAKAHTTQIAALHCRVTPGFLARLGGGAAKAVYDGYVQSEAVVGYVYLTGGKVEGYVIGSPAPRRLRRDALLGNPRRIGWQLLASIVRSPANLAGLVDYMRGPAEHGFDDEAAELIYIGVSPEARGAGIGKSLLEAFNRAMTERGVRSYELSVDATNEDAAAFYEAQGFRSLGEYSQFGGRHRRYRLLLRPDPA